MANFGFPHLTVVSPYEPHWREAKSAVGAEALLQNAPSTECLREALADCTFAVGTATIADRRPEQRVIPLTDLLPYVIQAIDHGGRAALVFGPEKRGLTREDLALCHLLVEIPTHPSQPSMNLGQAVAVCLYELAAHALDRTPGGNAPRLADPAGDPASMHDLDLLSQVVAETMEAARYSPAVMQKANRRDLDLLLRRLAVTGEDARRILGLFRRILWRLRH